MASRRRGYDVVYKTSSGDVRVKTFGNREDAKVFANAVRRRHKRAALTYAARRHRARENPSTGAWVAIGLGVTALGVGAYFLAKSMSSSSSSAPQLPPGTPPAPAGDKYVVVTIPGQSGQGLILLSQACAAARALAANGNAADAAAWAQVCTSNGGTV